MNEFEKVFRMHAVIRHQTGQRRAVLLVVTFLQFARIDTVDTAMCGNERAHLNVDLAEQVAIRRVQRVVQVENPEFGSSESGAILCSWREDSAPQRPIRQASPRNLTNILTVG